MKRAGWKKIDKYAWGKEEPDYNLNVLPSVLPARPPSGSPSYSVTTKVWRKIVYWGRLRDRKLHGTTNRFQWADCTAKVAVLGGGAFGTAMAAHLAKKGNPVSVVVRDESVRDFFNSRHANPKYLSEFKLPPNLVATTEVAEACKGCAAVVVALPVQSARKALEPIRQHIPKGIPVVAVSKGIEIGTGKLMADIISEALQRTPADNPIVMVSGPSFAREIMDERPTSVMAASTNIEAAMEVQRLLISPYFRVSTTDDIVGVEVAGSLKNVLAIGAGIVDGLDLGLNAMSAMVCQGTAEIRWLATAMGARPETLAGLAGMGDILLTCYGELSRNRALGARLGNGEPLEEILGSSGGVTEGVYTSKLVVELSDQYKVLLPVLTTIARILCGEVSARQAIYEVMALPSLAESS